jgi:hypothetical protein
MILLSDLTYFAAHTLKLTLEQPNSYRQSENVGTKFIRVNSHLAVEHGHSLDLWHCHHRSAHWRSLIAPHP